MKAGAADASTPTLRQHAVWLALILALALAFRVTWVVFSDWRPTPDDDAFRYDFSARMLAEGRGYIHLNGEPTAFWPPGYPLLLSAAYVVFGDSFRVAQLLNVALGTATVGLVYLVGRRTLGPQPALLGAAIIAAFPSLVFYTAVTLSETAFIFLTLLAVYLLLGEGRRRGPDDLRVLAVAGLVLGFASLVRGQALFLPLAFVPFWLRSGIDWGRVAQKLIVLGLGAGLIVGAWTTRNAIQMDAFVLISTNAGIAFWVGHNEGANGTDGILHRYNPPADYPELDHVEREVRFNNDTFRDGLSYAVTHPGHETVLVFRKLFWLYYKDDEGIKWNEGHGGQRFLSGGTRDALLDLSNIYYYALFGLFSLGSTIWFSPRDPGRLLLLALFLYWTAVHVAFVTDPRYHAPTLPVMALLAALPLQAAFARLTPRPSTVDP